MNSRSLPSLALLVPVLLGALPDDPPADADAAPFVVERGAEPDLLVPRGETLTYGAVLKLGAITARVGTATVESGVEPYRESALLSRGKATGEQAFLRARAFGDYQVYTLDANLEARFLPKDWPSLIQRQEQRGSERRRRETMTGTKGGEVVASFRSDTSDGAPVGARVWRQPEEFPVPEHALEALGGTYLARSAVARGEDSVSFPMIDKVRVWQVDVALGEPERVKTPAGVFLAREAVMTTSLVSKRGEVADREDKEDEGEFEGPFGLSGSIRVWLEAETGVPVQIVGNLPAGPVRIKLDILLEQYAGTPPGFAPVEAGG